MYKGNNRVFIKSINLMHLLASIMAAIRQSSSKNCGKKLLQEVIKPIAYIPKHIYLRDITQSRNGGSYTIVCGNQITFCLLFPLTKCNIIDDRHIKEN